MLVILEIPDHGKAKVATARLEKTPNGWAAYLCFDDGRTFYTEDKVATDELDGTMMDLDYLVRGFLPQPGGRRFAVADGAIGVVKKGGGK